MYWHDKRERDNTPKYFCVEKIPKSTVEQVSHERYISHESYISSLYSGRLFLTLKTEQDLLIGSGEVETENNKQYLTFARIYCDNKVVIPGSSLKGPIRAYLEALSPSCISTDQDACRREDKPCPACAIFGKQDYQGRVFFEDGVKIKGEMNRKRIVQRRGPKPWRACVNGRKFYYFEEPSQVSGRDYERIEVVKQGAEFKFEIEFINLHDWELGLLLLSMGLDNRNERDFSLKIGGGKNRKLGKVKITLDRDRIEFIKKHDWLKNKIKGEVIQSQEITKNDLIDAYWQKCQEWKIKTQVEEIIQKFKKGAPDVQQKKTAN